MENFTHRVSLKKPEKPEPWTDPETGEIYPGGKPIDPAEVYTPSQAPTPTFQQAPAFEQDVMPQQTNPPAPRQAGVSPAPGAASCFCRSCGQGITTSDRFCPRCGAVQFGEQPQQVIINNYNTNNVNSGNTIVGGLPRNKWLAVALCLFLGWLGVHRFYEHKTATGILWLCTGGLLGIGWLIDFFILLFKPTTYYVKNK